MATRAWGQSQRVEGQAWDAFPELAHRRAVPGQRLAVIGRLSAGGVLAYPQRAATTPNMPFSLCRRHLAAVIVQVTEALWVCEVGGV